jgi:antitoxin ParD1/3/4
MTPTLEITLSEPLRAFVEEQVAGGSYATASNYLEELVREDQKRRAQMRLEALLLEGLDSGPPITVTPEYWEQKRARLLARVSDSQATTATKANS